METDAPSVTPLVITSQRTKSNEVAYVLLEDCTICIFCDCNSASNLPEATWIPVVGSSDSDNPYFERDSVSPRPSCHRGDLVLKPIQQVSTTTTKKNSSSHILAIVNHNLAFDGTVADLCHSNGCCAARGNRSDAALMVGLVQTCQSTKQIQIESMQIMLRCVESRTKEDINNEPYWRVAALLITFSIPNLDEAETDIKPQKTPMPLPLPSSVQLLYSLLRSDWDYLDHDIMIRLRDPIPLNNSSRYHLGIDGTVIQGQISLFPSQKLSLHELYIRIRGTSNQKWKPLQKSTKIDCLINALPEDVLVNHLAPFLQAKSLDCLRSSCTNLHTVLRAIVPGLKLQLFQHQIASLEFMRRREINELSEEYSLSTNDSNSSVAYGGDIHRAITGGVSVCVQLRKDHHCRFRLDQQNGNAYHTSSHRRYHDVVLPRKAARGGILCNEPGVGKTITFLSLILQTFGLYSKTKSEEISSNRTKIYCDEHIFLAHWKEETTPECQRSELFRLCKKLMQSHSLSYSFFNLADPVKGSIPDYLNVVKSPLCFDDIYRRVDADFYSSDFTLFVVDIRLCIQNEMCYIPVDHELRRAGKVMITCFENLLLVFKSDQVISAKMRFSNAAVTPNSSIAAILDKMTKMEYLDSLLTSKATLLVVPNNRLNHWEKQITMHIDFSYCANQKEALIFQFTDNDFGSQSRISEILTNCSKDQTQYPLVFIDKSGTKKLPDEQFLSLFTVVLTTTQRLTNEWNNQRVKEKFDAEEDLFDGPFMTWHPTTQDCSLLKMHWTRLIVDDDHASERGKESRAINFALWISAQRRWVITGAPTPPTVAQSSLSNMSTMIHFLQHDFFGSRLNGDRFWHNEIVQSWNDGHIVSFFRLRNLIAMIMIRHTKLDIAELSLPRFTKTCAQLSVQEIKAYNTLVCAVQSNLLLTSMKGNLKGLQVPLLHRLQTKYAKEFLNTLRLACSGGARVIPTLTKVAFDKTIDLLISHKVDLVDIKVVEDYLHRALAEELTSCMCCGIELNTMLVTTCAHLVCTECVTTEMRSCPVCEVPFDVDDFQLLQPNMLYEWAWNIENSNANIITGNKNVPIHGFGILSAVRHAPRRGGERLALQRLRPNGDHECIYDATATDRKCLICLEEHATCVMDSESLRCAKCHRQAEACPEDESKVLYVIKKLQALQFAYFSRPSSSKSKAAESLIEEKITKDKPRQPKVIIFSQFRPLLNAFGHRILRRFGAGCVAEYWGRLRSDELMKFSTSNDCFCLLLGIDWSEGLDLSYVTHIIFLEEVWDKSLQSEVVASAWRIGACGHVEVEKLIAKDSVESLMANLQEKLVWQEGDEIGDNFSGDSNDPLLDPETESQRAKQNFLLTNAKLIKPHVRCFDNNQTMKRKYVEDVSPGAEAA